MTSNNKDAGQPAEDGCGCDNAGCKSGGCGDARGTGVPIIKPRTRTRELMEMPTLVSQFPVRVGDHEFPFMVARCG